MALISVSDITTYMDVALSNTQEDAATLIIDGLQSELEGYLRRPIEPTEFTETYRVDDIVANVGAHHLYYSYSSDAYGSLTLPPAVISPVYRLYLDNSPVISVDELSITPASSGATPQLQVAERDYITRKYGVDVFNASTNDVITITYTAGLQGDDIKVFKLLMLRAATREMQNMHDDVVGLKDLTTRNVAPLDTGFTDRELASVRRFRRVRV